MARNQSINKPNAKVKNGLTGGMGWSLALHTLIIVIVLTTMSSNNVTPPIMVSLHTDPGKEIKPIRAGLVDKRPYELAQQQRLEAERLLQQQQQLEKEQAQKALELARIQKENAEQAKLAAEAAAKIAAQQKQAAETAAKIAAQQKMRQKQQELKQIADSKIAEKKSAEKKAAAIKAEHDRLQAEHNAVLLQEVDKYKAMFAAAIEENRIVSSVFAQSIKCKVRIRLLPDGSILSVNIIESSGNPAYDQMSTSAIYKSAPFPMPSDHELYAQLRDIVISFKNGEQADA